MTALSQSRLTPLFILVALQAGPRQINTVFDAVYIMYTKRSATSTVAHRPLRGRRQVALARRWS